MGAPGLGVPSRLGALHILEMKTLGFGVPLGLGLFAFGS